MKKIILVGATITVLIAACVFFASAREPEEPQKTVNAVQQAIEEHEEMSRSLEETVGWAPDETYAETLIGPDTFADPEGHYFSYWVCLRWNTQFMNADSEISLYTDAFDPTTAERSHEVKINDGTGTVYQKGGRNYLVWAVVVDGIERLQLLDCDPVITESEMIKMAESCEK